MTRLWFVAAESQQTLWCLYKASTVTVGVTHLPRPDIPSGTHTETDMNGISIVRGLTLFFPRRDSKEVPTISVLCVPLSFRCRWTLPVLWLGFLFRVQFSVPAALQLILCECVLWILKGSLCSFWSGQQWWPNSGGGQALLSKHKATSCFPDFFFFLWSSAV